MRIPQIKRYVVYVISFLCLWVCLQQITSQKQAKSSVDSHRASPGREVTTRQINLVTANNPSGPPSTILLWTPFFGSTKWDLPKIGKSPFVSRKCPYQNCEVVTNKQKYMKSADMLLFNCVKKDQVAVPKSRHPKQVYAAYCWEPPTLEDMRALKNIHFNMTITYRVDSEVTDWAGTFRSKDTPSPGSYVPKRPFNEKKKTVAWAVSNCNPASKRDAYVKELAKYVDVDIYGKCGTLKCPRMSAKCYEKFEKEYKFYLSFESSVCTDYVTEKLFYPMNYELVPVVLGGADYNKIAPPHSHINVKDFESPKKLAEYLIFLSNNEQEYNKYFQWKQTVMKGEHDLWCDICQAASKTASYHREIHPQQLLSWWNNGTCNNNLVPSLLAS